MAEIRLICPGCGSDYALPASAIPESGREVECTDCGRVWLAHLSDAIQAPTAEPERQAVMPSKRLAPDMLQFLKDEVEHERRLREAEGQTRFRPICSEPFETDWPATTVTLPAAATTTTPAGTRVIRHRPQAPAEPLPPAEPAPRAPAPAPQTAARVVPPCPEPTAKVPLKPAPAPMPPAPTPAPAAEQPAEDLPTATPAKRGSYAAGMALMLGLAAAVVAIYVVAPRLESGTAISDLLMQWHGGLDRARSWLDGRAASLLRG
ncbi:zinc-ribbon domain-containing protein [Paracoccus sp. 1_MG-2023]|uniref:zinc-ribbon domain-containing protein n=1 Tax=unclassified Paracoccus (in: a-proteobacteria) TaxID=2688777 RepID=UPI001C08BE13|nr:MULTISPECIES: zinc-ribbon domain-containing protein [unclassified Paracoccus (in: a-proteobacteria)]MBU2957010.1 zinc-ribbon domain-containing protein [Paracoccus sp. C2R09]MDO6668207.1 zinc-ribbon domain-containing protein [Paracoccus sp. 1_MG-2023]